MLVPVKWLKDYVRIDIPTKELCDRMTMTGSKVEGVTELASEISNVVVGKILSVESHPNADRLLVCKVDIGNDIIQVVTGAPNVRAGQLVPVALHGSTLPGGIKIKKGKIRGVESQGMMCSGEELKLKEEDYPGAEVDGILILNEDYPLGLDIKDALDLADEVIEFEITSNRPDCLSILGIAREAAVTIGSEFKAPSIVLKEGIGDINQEASVVVEDSNLCPRYCAKVVKDIKIGPSPMWMRRRLAAAGIRPINNIVDITNYVMLEMGQPMHAFDLDTVAEHKIIVRRAYENEKIVTLDGKERILSPDTIVIADPEKAIGLAGVMGGANSEITERTKNILLESAIFNGTNIRLTSKALGLRSEASNRFEKGMDFTNTVAALDRAAQLIQELGAGTVVNGTIDICSKEFKPKRLDIQWRKVNQLLGLDLSPEKMVDILTRLSFEVEKAGDFMSITVPSFRLDIEGVADIAEEIARIYGYNNIPMTFMEGTSVHSSTTTRQYFTDLVKDVLVGLGLYEVVTYSFTSPKVFELLRMNREGEQPLTVRIANPLGEDQSIMRTTLISSILEVLSRNYNRRMESCKIFEINRIFLPRKLPLDELPEERNMLAIGEYGAGVDFYDIKAKIEILLDSFGVLRDVTFSPCVHPTFHPGRTARIKIGERDLGLIGEIHPEVQNNYDLDTRVYIAELDFDLLLNEARKERKYVPLPKFPAITRDLAIIVNKNILAKEVENTIKKAGGPLLEKVELFDIYEGNQIPKGYKSMAYALSFRDPEKTLKDEDVNKISEKIIKALEIELDAKLRQ